MSHEPGPLSRAWRGFWFAPAAPLNLAAARVVLAGHALWILLSRDLPGSAALPPEFGFEVAASARWRYLLFAGQAPLERALHAVALCALLGALAGVRPRLCCAAAALLLYHLAPLDTLFFTPSPWSKGLTLAVLGLLVLACSRCGDALRFLPKASRPSAPAADYAWPLKLIQLFVCQAFVFAGYAKLVKSGWAWASAANMRGWLLLSTQNDQLAVFTAPGRWLADQPLACALMGPVALGLELGFLAVLVSGRARRLLVPAAALFHLAILVTLNYAYLNLPLLLLFVDWAGLRAPRRAGAAAPRPGDPGRA